MGLDDGGLRALAGIRIGEWLHTGRYLEVEELVTAEADRSRGYGHALLAWIAAYARNGIAASCAWSPACSAPTRTASTSAKAWPGSEVFLDGPRLKSAAADAPRGDAGERRRLPGIVGNAGRLLQDRLVWRNATLRRYRESLSVPLHGG